MSAQDTIEQLTAERDALAHVVYAAWKVARDTFDITADAMQEWMAEAGLTEEMPATTEEAERFEIDPGDPVMRLTALGRAALSGEI